MLAVIHCGMTAGSIDTHVLVLLVFEGPYFGPLLVTQRPTVIKTTGDYLLDNDNVSQDAQMGLLVSTKALMQQHRSWAWPALGLAVTLHVATVAAEPAKAPVPGSLSSCLKALSQPAGEEISCDYRALLTDEERTDMQKISRGMLQDANCIVKVRIARKIVEPALNEPDHVFEAPPQPVKCDIKTKDSAFPIEGTFAPKVTFKGGTAIDGSPGLANVTGVNKYLAWPLVQYVNRSAGIRQSMLEMINAYRTRLAKHE